MKKIGVVIPIYNVEKYLRECLDSVINQTYTNLEIILVNDGSTDEHSLNIAKEYTLKDKRITLFDKKN
ncbi:glycosyltransferase family 2 protein, partial [Campylobacter jejuni]